MNDTIRKQNREAQTRHYNKMKAAGLVKVSVYVPREDVGELRTAAEKLRKRYARMLRKLT